MKYKRLVSIFIFFSGVLLFLTAIAKLISAGGGVRILQEHDPILSLTFRCVFLIVGLFELAVALVCLFGKRIELQAGLIALLATNFAVYRLGLIWIGYHRPCKCLGNLTDALHIPPQTADTAMKIILAYLLIGSYATLFWLWRQRKKAATNTVGAASL
jgi:methylamine utilization protein MauE